MTPIGKGFKSLNVTLRRKLQLYANVRPCVTLEGLKNIYTGVNCVTVRENTEGEYSGLEHTVAPGIHESLKIISTYACERVARYAFDFARQHKRREVMAVHKSGVMKMGDGLFIKTCRKVAADYPEI